MFALPVNARQAKTASQAIPVRVSAAPHGVPGVARRPPAWKSEISRSAARAVDEVARSPGQPLAPDTQRRFAGGFGRDFSSVRIHADAPAGAAARALHANAYTAGAHIAFAPGLYQPGEPAGMRLLAHELAHVVQQRDGGSAPPGRAQEQDADAACRAVAAGEAPKVGAPSQVGIAAQPEQPGQPTAAKVKRTPLEQVMWFYRFYTEQLGYQHQAAGGNRGRLINPAGGHFVDITLDAQSPRMVSVVVAGKSYEASEFNFSSDKFETRARHIEMVEYERELSVPERIGIGVSSTGKIVGGAALCAWGAAETVGVGAAAACGYGADVAASGVRELRGEDSRTLTNQAVSGGLSHLVGQETAQELTDNAEAAVNIMLGAYGAATPPEAPVVPAGARPLAPDVALPEGASSAASESPKPQPARRLPGPSTPTVEPRTPATPDLGTPAASGSPRGVSTRPMKKLPGGAKRGSMSQAAGDPVAHAQSHPTVEVRTQRTPDYGKPASSAGPESRAPDAWKAPQQPTKPPAPRAPSGHHPAAGRAATDAQAQGLEDVQKGRVGMQEHRSAPAVRAATGQTGQGMDSTHLVPQAVHRALGLSPDLAQTVNLPNEVNKAIDSAWVPKWNKATRLGQQVTGGDVRRWVTEGIRNVPEKMLSQAAKNTFEWRLTVELRELGISDDTVIVPRIQ
jgi:hypothetical protein